ncbi:hypothetical protein BZM27_52225 [Paraburkholderia steynii]|uniref:Uncharacterized protein n=1 Tax=Paraburkholderia steynii TaxID=1245441 RepID=A0A4V2NFZ3_9BURK|nr:hypothetical protein BZM27_52225 [Paraburkholderia steynii]
MKPIDYACALSNAPGSMQILRNDSSMLVDPSNRLVADTLEQEWNHKLRILADAREQRERSQQQDRLILDDAILATGSSQ